MAWEMLRRHSSSLPRRWNWQRITRLVRRRRQTVADSAETEIIPEAHRIGTCGLVRGGCGLRRLCKWAMVSAGAVVSCFSATAQVSLYTVADLDCGIAHRFVWRQRM